MAHQLSCDDEHSDGTINQYYRRYFPGHVGEVELGASALAGIYYLAVYMLGFGFSIGLQVMIAGEMGNNIIKRRDVHFFREYISCRGWQSFFAYCSIWLLP